jgi:hypothetical protein
MYNFNEIKIMKINFVQCLIFLFLLSNRTWAGIARQNTSPEILQVQKKGKNLKVSAHVHREIKQVALRIESSRNFKISKITDVSPFNPVKTRPASPDQDIWYPELGTGAGTRCSVFIHLLFWDWLQSRN